MLFMASDNLFNEKQHSKAESGSCTSWLQNETVLLAQVVQFLGKRSGHMMLLSDLGALLPKQLRKDVKGVGGFRNWLQNFPGLLHVEGQPGQETVTLMMGGTMGTPGFPGTTSHERQRSTISPSAHCHVPLLPSIKFACDSSDIDDDTRDGACTMQMRGLPYQASVSDIKAFLGAHVKELKEETGSRAIQLVANRNGKPSGYARVQFNSIESAQRCKEELHMRTMNDRYIECFMYSDCSWVYKGALKNTEVEYPWPAWPTRSVINVSHISSEQVRQQIEEHMWAVGQNRVLLSNLGVALSQEVRTFLKRTGLKSFLALYPHLFHVQGTKGYETLWYLPGLQAEEELMTSNSCENEPCSPPFDTRYLPGLHAEEEVSRSNSHESKLCSPPIESVGRPCPRLSDVDRRSDSEPSSPRVGELKDGESLPGTPNVLKTPSNWGTPSIFSEDDMPVQWATQTKPQSPRGSYDMSSLGGFTRPPQAWIGAVPIIPLFPIWQGPPAPLQGNWSARANPAAKLMTPVEDVAAMVAEAENTDGNKRWESLPHDEKEHNSENASEYEAQPLTATAAAVGSAAVTKGLECRDQNEQDFDKENSLEVEAQIRLKKDAALVEAPRQPLLEASPEKNNRQWGGLDTQITAMRLRGLPLTASEQDVLELFSFHNVIEAIADGDGAVRMVLEVDAMPSGQAIVQIKNRREADNARKVLDSQWMGNHLIEVISDVTPESESKSSHQQDEILKPQSKHSTHPWRLKKRSTGLTCSSGNLFQASLVERPPLNEKSIDQVNVSDSLSMQLEKLRVLLHND